jgi:hypothetical protein
MSDETVIVDTNTIMTDDFEFKTIKKNKKMSNFNKQIGGDHYLGWKIQPMEFFIANKIPKAEGDIIQYLLRHKGNRKEDLKKARHILDMLIESLDREPNQP